MHSEINNAQSDDFFTSPSILSVCPSLMDCTNVIECSDIYSKRSGSLWQYYRDEPALSNAGSIVDFPTTTTTTTTATATATTTTTTTTTTTNNNNGNNNSILFKFKEKITRQRKNDGTKDVEIMVPLHLDSHLPKKNCCICFHESPLQMMELFIVKALFFLKTFKCLFSILWSCRKNDLIRKIRSI